MSRNTQLIFNNMAVYIAAPHIPFQTPFPVTLTIEFGNGPITTASYQVIGDNQTETTMYMQGGGGIGLDESAIIYTGSCRLTGNIYYPTNPQRLITQYNGPIQIKINGSKACLTATLSAIGEGTLLNTRLLATLTGDALVNTVCGIRYISFDNSSMRLAIPIPS